MQRSLEKLSTHELGRRRRSEDRASGRSNFIRSAAATALSLLRLVDYPL